MLKKRTIFYLVRTIYVPKMVSCEQQFSIFKDTFEFIHVKILTEKKQFK